MRLFDPYETDPDRPACHCEECGGELYPEDLLYLIDGGPICVDCLGQLAQTYFAPQRMLGRQLLDYSAY